MLLALVLLIAGFFVSGTKGVTMIATGVTLGMLAGLELSVREHFAGYRSHSTVLAGFPAVVVLGVGFLAQGWPQAVNLVAGARRLRVGLLPAAGGVQAAFRGARLPVIAAGGAYECRAHLGERDPAGRDHVPGQPRALGRRARSAWLWVGAQVQAETGSVGLALFAMMVGMLVSVTMLVSVLGWLGRKHLELLELRGREIGETTPLEQVLVGSAAVAVIGFAVWFFGFSGSAPLPGLELSY